MKHTFPLGHKYGGNKKKPYRTKQVGVRVPESIHSEVVAMVKDKVKQWKQGYNSVDDVRYSLTKL